MAKFRKKPIEIEAMQFDGTHDSACRIDGWSVGRAQAMFDADTDLFMGKMIIHTIEGDMTANPSDYIIKGVKSEFYPCKPDIFEATYELVADAAA